MVGVVDDHSQFHTHTDRVGICLVSSEDCDSTSGVFCGDDRHSGFIAIPLFPGAMKQVIIIRKDLNMRKGKMIAQGAHASVLAVLWYLWHPFTWWWICTKFTKIAVSVDTEHELLEAFGAAYRQLPRSLVRDAGKTKFHGRGTWTAVAIGPGPNKSIDKITGHLKLL